jgi:hypothetical protein
MYPAYFSAAFFAIVIFGLIGNGSKYPEARRISGINKRGES